MYETRTDMCPLKCYRKYLSKCNTACDALFQTPRDAFNDSDGVLYEKRHLGKNKLGSMMCEISKIAKLSKKYTNHGIRATAITALDQAGLHLVTWCLFRVIEVKHRSKVIQGKLQRTTKGKCQKHSVNLFHWIMVALLLIRMRLTILRKHWQFWSWNISKLWWVIVHVSSWNIIDFASPYKYNGNWKQKPKQYCCSGKG